MSYCVTWHALKKREQKARLQALAQGLAAHMAAGYLQAALELCLARWDHVPRCAVCLACEREESEAAA